MPEFVHRFTATSQVEFALPALPGSGYQDAVARRIANGDRVDGCRASME